MSHFSFNSFFILVQDIILRLNVSSYPPVYEKDTKIFVWNCALHSSSGVVFDCCAYAHIGSCTRARSGEKHCLSRSGDPGVLANVVFFFFTSRVLCLLIFSRKLKQDKWISFLNE
jgi:hypothetical protein